jgi:glycosyltransferase involved in cell wall biosynthesis
VQDLKISIITVSFNARAKIKHCIESVLAQSYSNIEYIIIDGGSTDGTSQVIDQYKQHIDFFVSEPDKGIYDAMNKGIALATGDIVGTLNADDVFADTGVLDDIAESFKLSGADIVYGNLIYIKPNGGVLRKWDSGRYKDGNFNWGWMPPHPTFYCKRQLFKRFGLYDPEFGTAGDYELMLRFIHLNKVTPFYLDRIIVNMGTGGVSNFSYRNRVLAWGFDLKAMGKNGVMFPLFAIVLKPCRKILQYIQ